MKLLTKQEIEKLLNNLEVARDIESKVRALLDLDEAAYYLARTALDALARLEDAEAAQALILGAEVRGSKAMSQNDFDCLILDGIAEALKAMRKFPQPNYVISKVAEEAGEVVKAAIHCAEGRETAVNLRGEMKQLIAMLYRLWVEGDQVHGLPSVAAALRKDEETPK